MKEHDYEKDYEWCVEDFRKLIKTFNDNMLSRNLGMYKCWHEATKCHLNSKDKLDEYWNAKKIKKLYELLELEYNIRHHKLSN